MNMTTEDIVYGIETGTLNQVFLPEVLLTMEVENPRKRKVPEVRLDNKERVKVVKQVEIIGKVLETERFNDDDWKNIHSPKKLMNWKRIANELASQIAEALGTKIRENGFEPENKELVERMLGKLVILSVKIRSENCLEESVAVNELVRASLWTLEMCIIERMDSEKSLRFGTTISEKICLLLYGLRRAARGKLDGVISFIGTHNVGELELDKQYDFSKAMERGDSYRKEYLPFVCNVDGDDEKLSKLLSLIMVEESMAGTDVNRRKKLQSGLLSSLILFEMGNPREARLVAEMSLLQKGLVPSLWSLTIMASVRRSLEDHTRMWDLVDLIETEDWLIGKIVERVFVISSMYGSTGALAKLGETGFLNTRSHKKEGIKGEKVLLRHSITGVPLVRLVNETYEQKGNKKDKPLLISELKHRIGGWLVESSSGEAFTRGRTYIKCDKEDRFNFNVKLVDSNNSKVYKVKEDTHRHCGQDSVSTHERYRRTFCDHFSMEYEDNSRRKAMKRVLPFIKWKVVRKENEM